MAAETVPEQVALALCAIRKRADPALWVGGEKAGAVSSTFGVLCDPPRPGLVVEIDINRGSKAKRRTVNFGLWDTSAGGYVRVYQLTVADSNSPTHSKRGIVWYGSHEHMGDSDTHRPEWDKESFDDALARFLKTATLELESTIEDPLDPDKFTLK